MTDPSNSFRDPINGPLSFLASISPREEHRRVYGTYLRSLSSATLESIVYGGRPWQSRAAMWELINRGGHSRLPDEEFKTIIKKIRDRYWIEHVRPKKLAWWREYITTGRFYRDKAAENAEILNARRNRSWSTYKKKRNRRAITIPGWVRTELRAEISIARKAALLAGLKV